jgi:hypothetical protein
MNWPDSAIPESTNPATSGTFFLRLSKSAHPRPSRLAPHSGNEASALVFARERADIAELPGFLCWLRVSILRAPREDNGALRCRRNKIELDHVPGNGLLARAEMPTRAVASVIPLCGKKR